MTLGIAAIVIFVLYLIDKHSRWKAAFKIVCWTAGVAAVCFGLFYGYASYTDYRAAHPKLDLSTDIPLAQSNTSAPTVPPPAGFVPDGKIDLSAGLAPKPVWIYVDIAEEFGGAFSKHPVVPVQISQMLNKQRTCKPGSVTYGPDKVEWICVQPEVVNLPPGYEDAVSQPKH